MPKREVPLKQLSEFLPFGSEEIVLDYLNLYKVHLTITRKRSSILGDYRNAHSGKPHRISVNGNLNQFSFLITLLHELAHLLTFETYAHRASPHGKEWKTIFGKLLSQFIQKNIFPLEIETALQRTLKNPAASSCGDTNLLRVLRNYDAQKENHFLVEQLTEGTAFCISDGRIFIRGKKIRTRYHCEEIGTKKRYLFSGLYEVQLANH